MTLWAWSSLIEKLYCSTCVLVCCSLLVHDNLIFICILKIFGIRYLLHVSLFIVGLKQDDGCLLHGIKGCQVTGVRSVTQTSLVVLSIFITIAVYCKDWIMIPCCLVDLCQYIEGIWCLCQCRRKCWRRRQQICPDIGTCCQTTWCHPRRPCS